MLSAKRPTEARDGALHLYDVVTAQPKGHCYTDRHAHTHTLRIPTTY